ncbi:hypothetical protein MLD38_033132 [Melastoma candidum]|uniref:Uncharacterized protein n=1 Tax=Melastoma candidum TaxID=119954 RepID=A0ACB9M9H0_9MYRT|nr:hypothetical protein MLD38_033132 [Melastoma candidum]
MERVWKANIDMSPSCPRCGSSNTKFCYYNNYSLTQPRYFCKGCRRYWTKGGSLRNVPVGGGCRRNRRSRSIRVSTAEAASRASLGYGSGGLIKAKCFDSTTAASSASPDGSHIDLVLVYANYLNQKPESKGDHETNQQGGGGGFDDQFTPKEKQVDPDIEFLGGNELLGCEFLSNLFAESNMNTENHMYHEGFGATDISHGRILDYDGIDAGNYSLPPLPNEEVVISWPESENDTATHGFEEPGLLPTVFGMEGQQEDQSYIIANWHDFDMPLDDAFRK